MLFAEFLDERRIGQIRVGDDSLGDGSILPPSSGRDLRFGEFVCPSALSRFSFGRAVATAVKLPSENGSIDAQ